MTEYAICINGKEQRYTDYSKALADLQQIVDQYDILLPYELYDKLQQDHYVEVTVNV